MKKPIHTSNKQLVLTKTSYTQDTCSTQSPQWTAGIWTREVNDYPIDLLRAVPLLKNEYINIFFPVSSRQLVRNLTGQRFQSDDDRITTLNSCFQDLL